MRLRPALAVLLGTAAVACSSPASTTAPAPTRTAADPVGWTGSWATAATEAGTDGVAAQGLTGVTLRQVLQLSVGGPALRLRLTNAFGSGPLEVTGARLALTDGGDGVPATFGGEDRVSIPAGGEVASDPIALTVPDRADVLVSTTFPGPTGPLTQHPDALSTTYAAPAGTAGFVPVSTSWYALAGIDVPATSAAGSVVALGDSITDGFASTPGTDRRYPDVLAARLLAAGLRTGVLNAGISGNRVLDDSGTSGVAVDERLQRDVLDEPGVRSVLLLEGINDLAAGRGELAPDELTDAYTELVDRLHRSGIRVVIGTLTPFGGSPTATTGGEAARQAVNTWIMTSGVPDAAVDLDAAVRDPSDPSRFAPVYDSGDHLHPSDAGYAAMAGAVDLASV